jgi:hypothetical protein
MNSHESRITLESEFLTKTENYTMQIERFVINTTPVVNLIDTPYLTIHNLPVLDDAQLIDVDDQKDGLIEHGSFTPNNPKTVLEIFYQLNEFVKNHTGLDVKYEPGFEIRFTLNRVFGQRYYLKLNQQFADLIGLSKYVFFFKTYGVAGDAVSVYPQTATSLNQLFYTHEELLLADAVLYADTDSESILKPVSTTALTDPRTFRSKFSLKALDTRLEYDVLCTVNTDSKVEALDGVEGIKKIVARFPVGELITRYDVLNLDQNDNRISEICNVGLEDLARKNPDSQTLLLGNGEILVLNTRIECRYMENKTIVTKPADFSSNGFFYLQLLFSKRLK